MITDKEKVEIYERFIDNLYMYSTLTLDARGMQTLISNAARLSRAGGQYDETEQARDLIDKRLKNLNLISFP